MRTVVEIKEREGGDFDLSPSPRVLCRRLMVIMAKDDNFGSPRIRAEVHSELLITLLMAERQTISSSPTPPPPWPFWAPSSLTWIWNHLQLITSHGLLPYTRPSPGDNFQRRAQTPLRITPQRIPVAHRVKCRLSPWLGQPYMIKLLPALGSLPEFLQP